MKKHLALFQDVFCSAWEKTKQHAWFIFLTFIIVTVITSSVSRSSGLSFIIDAMVCLSFASIALLIIKNHDFTFRDLFTPLLSPRKALAFIILFFLYGLVSLTGFAVIFGLVNAQVQTPLILLAVVCLVLPGLYVAIRTMLFPFVVVEHENARLQDLIKMSYMLTNKHFCLSASYFVIVVVVLLVVKSIAPPILLLFTPIFHFSLAALYLRLKEHHNG